MSGRVKGLVERADESGFEIIAPYGYHFAVDDHVHLLFTSTERDAKRLAREGPFKRCGMDCPDLAEKKKRPKT